MCFAAWESFTKLTEDFATSMRAEDFLKPAWIRLGAFGGNNFYDIALLKLGIKITHFAVDFGTGAASTDFAMKAVGKV